MGYRVQWVPHRVHPAPSIYQSDIVTGHYVVQVRREVSRSFTQASKAITECTKRCYKIFDYTGVRKVCWCYKRHYNLTYELINTNAVKLFTRVLTLNKNLP